MAFFKNIWDFGKSSKSIEDNVTDKFRADVLSKGPHEWEKSSDQWKINGVVAANYDDSSVELSPDHLAIIPSDDRTLIKSRADIIIVIDPGHGIGSENVGASLIKGYKYKVRDDATGKVKTETDAQTGTLVEVHEKNDIGQLPDYVISDIASAVWKGNKATKSSWVVEVYNWPVDTGGNAKTKEEKEAAELTNKLERVLTWQVAQELISIFRSIGYTVYTTRESVVDGMIISQRIKIIHGFNPDYMISLHCDGDNNYRMRGAHSTYRIDNKDQIFIDNQMTFAEDVVTAYGDTGILPLLAPSVRRRGSDVGVLTPRDTPKLIRKTLLEMGFGTNPEDYNAIYDNRHELARHIVMGVEKNVNRSFGVLSNEIIGFQSPQGKTVLYKNSQDDTSNGIGGVKKNNLVYRVDDLPPPPAY